MRKRNLIIRENGFWRFPEDATGNLSISDILGYNVTKKVSRSGRKV